MSTKISRRASAPLAQAYVQVIQRPPRASGLSAADREDVVHDACLRVLSAPPDKDITNLSGYLQRVARNLTIDRHRSRARLGDLFAANDDWQDTAATVLDPERIVSDREHLEIVRSAIESLPPRCAEAMRLHRFVGLSYPEIARQMGVSTSMVEKHISEALVRLAHALAEADALPRPARRRSHRVAIGIGCIIAVTVGLMQWMNSPFWTTLDWTTR